MSDPTPSRPQPQHTPLPESERTIVRPRAGVRSFGTSYGGTEPAPAVATPSLPDDTSVAAPGDNPLLVSAQPLLSLVPQMRAAPDHRDPHGLKESLADGIRGFEQSATRAGVPRESVIAARYILCTFLDETAASTPWGSGGVWAADTLLVRFHNETWGGEKVFLLLSKLAEDPAKNRNLLELIYCCLALGFEGRYRVLDNGRSQLEQLRERLHQMLRKVIPAPERALSLRWAPAAVRERRWLSTTPFWVFCAAMALVALGIYFTYTFLLANRSDPVFSAIQSIRLPSAAPLPPPAPPPPAARNRLGRFLEQEIREGLVTVRDEANKSVVLIQGDGLFAPGSVAIAERVKPILTRIGNGLAANLGKVLIAGHTDSQPIRSARFPSNWHLSQERARTVLQYLTATVAAERMQAEGRADAEPLAPNDSAAGMARNRRVEITLFVSN